MISSKHISIKITWEEHRVLNVSLDSIVGKFGLSLYALISALYGRKLSEDSLNNQKNTILEWLVI
jgi:hypothetical protein